MSSWDAARGRFPLIVASAPRVAQLASGCDPPLRRARHLAQGKLGARMAREEIGCPSTYWRKTSSRRLRQAR